MWLLAENRDIEAYINQLKWQRDRLADSANVADTFKDDIKANSPHQYNAEAAMVSTLTGLVYPLRLLIGEAPDKRKTFRKGIAYTVVDATSPETQDQYQGDWPAADSAGHLKAIQRALDDFGDDATYGEGLIVVRIPPPTHDQQEHSAAGSQATPNPIAYAHPGPALTYHKSSPGPLQLVLKALAIIAMVAGAVALSLTGAGAPAAAALLGFIAASAGAIEAVQSMRQRSRRHKLEWDAETALDIVSIVSVIPAGIGAKFAMQASALARGNAAAIPAWLQSVERAQRLLRIYGATEMGGSLYLVHEKLEDDIKKIELLADAHEAFPGRQAQAARPGVQRRDDLGGDDGRRRRSCPRRRGDEAGPFLVCRDRAIAAAGRPARARGIAPGLPVAAGAQCARRPGRADPGRAGLHRPHRPRSQQASGGGRQRAPGAAAARAGPASRRVCQARGCPGGGPRPAEAPRQRA